MRDREQFHDLHRIARDAVSVIPRGIEFHRDHFLMRTSGERSVAVERPGHTKLGFEIDLLLLADFPDQSMHD